MNEQDTLQEVIFAWAALDARLADLVAIHADDAAHDMRGTSALYAQMQIAGQIGAAMLMYDALPMEHWMPATNDIDQPTYPTPVDVMQYLLDALRSQPEDMARVGIDLSSVAMQLAVMKGTNNQSRERDDSAASLEF